jgi:hypothetical protein
MRSSLIFTSRGTRRVAASYGDDKSFPREGFDIRCLQVSIRPLRWIRRQGAPKVFFVSPFGFRGAHKGKILIFNATPSGPERPINVNYLPCHAFHGNEQNVEVHRGRQNKPEELSRGSFNREAVKQTPLDVSSQTSKRNLGRSTSFCTISSSLTRRSCSCLEILCTQLVFNIGAMGHVRFPCCGANKTS